MQKPPTVESEPNIAAKQEVFHCELTVQIDNVETVETICDSLKKLKESNPARRTS